jgi:hypothetical protein
MPRESPLGTSGRKIVTYITREDVRPVPDFVDN